MTRQKLLLSVWRAVWMAAVLGVVAVPGYLIFFGPERESRHPGNPIWEREQADPAYAARQQEARAEAAYIHKRTNYWLGQIASQNASFREAACEIDCRGYWDADDNVCRKQLHDDPEPIAPGKSHRIDQCV